MPRAGGGRTGVRVVAGRFRGLRLATPAGIEIRPTADRVKEALFSILGARVAGARVVDAFAGTGALGIEALSRGAAGVAFVERGRRPLALLEGNLARLGEGGEAARVVAMDALRPEAWPGGVLPADLVLADPPYRMGLGEAFLAALAGVEALAPGGVLVLEHETGTAPAHPSWQNVQRRVYGDTALSWYREEPAKGGLHADGDLSGHV